MKEFIDIHSHILEKRENIISYPTISVTDDRIFKEEGQFWCGLHPSEDMDEKLLIDRLSSVGDNIFGIGEIGLDKIHGSSNQYRLFDVQLDLAKQMDKAVTIHNVRSYSDIEKKVRDKKIKKVIMHSFIGSEQMMSEIIKNEWRISVGARSLKSIKTLDAIKKMPIEFLFIESDEKDDIIELYNSVSKILGYKIEVLKEKIYNNYLWLIS